MADERKGPWSTVMVWGGHEWLVQLRDGSMSEVARMPLDQWAALSATQLVVDEAATARQDREESPPHRQGWQPPRRPPTGAAARRG